MTPTESTRFNDALHEKFSDYEIKIIQAIMSGKNNFNQDDIIRTSEEGIVLLRKLGWYSKVKTAIKNANLHLLENNQIKL